MDVQEQRHSNSLDSNSEVKTKTTEATRNL